MIQNVLREELQRIQEIQTQSFTDPWSLKMLKKSFHQPQTRMCSLWKQKSTVAYCIASMVADECEILSVAVLPEHRRKGHARALLGDLTNHARKEGIRTIYLEVQSGNSSARAFYVVLGYEMVGERRSYYRDGENAVVLSLNISND